MPKCCSVYNCKATSENAPDRTFHQYPSDSKLRTDWIKRIRRMNFTPSAYSYVCSYHFLVQDFREPNKDSPAKFRKTTLKPGIIPAWNLRGEKNDERTPKRNSHTSKKARYALQPTLGKQQQQDDQNCDLSKLSRNENESDQRVSPMDTGENVCLELKETENKLEKAKQENRELKGKLFRYKNLKEDHLKSYTGLDTSVFQAVIGMIKRFFPLTYWSGKTVTSISVEDELLIFLMKLRLDLPYFDLASRYSVSHTTIQNIFLTYLHTFHEIFFVGCMNKLPSLEKNKVCLPHSFDNITNCRVIIDCTEFRIEAPRKDLEAAARTYSNYKHYLSAKYLLGVAPNGAITFVSQGFPGSTSDKVAGDLILADKGFLIHDLLPKNVFLNLPAFLAGKTQFTKEEAVFSRQISRCRIHVERAIERLRNYKILGLITAPLRPYVDTIVQVCATLVNLQTPIITGVLENY